MDGFFLLESARIEPLHYISNHMLLSIFKSFRAKKKQFKYLTFENKLGELFHFEHSRKSNLETI